MQREKAAIILSKLEEAQREILDLAHICHFNNLPASFQETKTAHSLILKAKRLISNQV